jgi:DMSO/TMAO reductase YedYZ molybdopterin-dependent catalytic subunit
MNGEPLTQAHGAPVRLIVPGWYAVAWVKWLSWIELHDRRFMGRFMGRDYVTIRGEQVGDKVVWRETSVSRLNPKSIIAEVVRKKDQMLRVSGAAWTDLTGVKAVEVQIDGGAWAPAELEKKDEGAYSWTFFHFDWKDAKPGEHTLVSRAIDNAGRTQPAKDDPYMKLKKTYWEANEQFPRKVKL